MLLALDAGNTNITVGVFEQEHIICRWRLRTVHEQTADEWGVLLRNLFDLGGQNFARIDGVIAASVVPPIEPTLVAMAQRYFHRDPVFVGPETDTGLKILYDNPSEVGADRVVNAVEAFHRLGGPCVVVDLGTAITFDAVSAAGEYLGGVICPGIGMSARSLFSRTARLPLVDFRQPDKLIGSNTAGSIRSGLYYGALGMIDGILERLIQALGGEVRTIATGGQASLVVSGSRFVTEVDEDLTLKGLARIWRRQAR